MRVFTYLLRHTEHKGRFITGIIMSGLQYISVLFTFISIWLGFSWIKSLTPKSFAIIALIQVLGLVISFGCAYLSNIFASQESYELHAALRLQLAEALKKTPLSYFSQEQNSRVITIFTSVLTLVEQMSIFTLFTTLQGIATALFMLIGIFSSSLALGILMLVLLSIYALILTRLYKESDKHSERDLQQKLLLSSSVLNALKGMSVLKSYPMQAAQMQSSCAAGCSHSYAVSAPAEHLQTNANLNADQQGVEALYQNIHKRVESHSLGLVDISNAFERNYTVLDKLGQFYLSLSGFIFTLAVVYLYSLGSIDLPTALVLSLAGAFIFMGFTAFSLATVLHTLIPGNIKRVEDTLISAPVLSEGSLETLPAENSITFDHVSFSYEPDKETIKDLSLSIPAKSKVALVGPSGSGKTTIISLIARFYEPSQGEIRLGDKPLSEYQVDTLLKGLSLVFQDVYLFDDTIAHNIKIAKPEASDEELIEVCKRARCHEFISELPEGYNTIVGDRGSRLSGGERQRISIARALLKDAPIILLDEATSSVDPENEHEIICAINELCADKTVISIAHRLSTVRDADKIFVIDEGRLAQEGTHEELLAQEGIYKRFIKARQAAGSWSLG